MKYTVRYAHLKTISKLKVGDLVKEGDLIGVQGNTGQSTGKHLHIDCVEGLQEKNWKLVDVEDGRQKSSPRQLNYFIDKDLFKNDFTITTYYCDPNYINNKLHFGYDLVGCSDKIYWNRSKVGQVQATGSDVAYGNYILVGFEA